MTLQIILLQSMAERLAGGAGDFFSTLTSSIGIIAIIGLLIAGAFGGLMLIIFLKRRFDFEGAGEPIGHVHIDIMNKYILEGNLAKWQMIDDEQLDLLKKEDDSLSIVPNVIRQMFKEGTLWIYTMRSPDDSDIRDKFGNRTYIISSGDLTSDKYSWFSQKGKFTWRSLLTKEKTRYIVAYSSFKKMQIMNEDRNLDDWWIIAPIPIVGLTEEIGYDSRVMGGMRHNITIKIIENAKALATGLNYLPFVADALSKNDYLVKERDKVNELLEQRTKQLLEVNQKFQKKKRQLGQKPYVVSGKGEETKKVQQNVMMMLVSVVMGSMAVMFIPDFFKNMPTQSAQFLGMIVAVVIIAGLAYMQNKAKPEEEKVLEQE